MFKSILEWLTMADPIQRWILLLLLLISVIGLAAFLKEFTKKHIQGE